MWPMVATHFIKTRLSHPEKQRVHALASQQLITESVWLRRLIVAALGEASDTGSHVDPLLAGSSDAPHRARLDIRLRAEDRLLIQERAAARGMRAATTFRSSSAPICDTWRLSLRTSSQPSTAASPNSMPSAATSTRSLAPSTNEPHPPH